MAERKVTVYVCDRCGNEHRHLNNKGRQPRPKGWTNLADYDFCESCTAAFRAWLAQAEPMDLVLEQSKADAEDAAAPINGAS